jgi:hypothetical protein
VSRERKKRWRETKNLTDEFRFQREEKICSFRFANVQGESHALPFIFIK